MSGARAEDEIPNVPRAESVLSDARSERRAVREYRAFGIATDDFLRHLAMLEVRTRTGDRSLFAYHLLGRVNWNPSHGMTLVFGDAKVTLHGRNLSDLFTAIRDHKVTWVQEADGVVSELVAPAVPVIESVVIEPHVATR